jgi:actin-like ATPase involved in cell morphogenesis
MAQPAFNGNGEELLRPHVLADQVASVWKSLPERVQVEVIENGVMLTGGGGERADVVSAMEERTRLKVRVAERPGQAVIRGLARLASGLRAA